MLSIVSRTIFMSGRLAPSTASPMGMPSASTNRLRLAPFLARSVGFFPVFFPPEGCLGHAPVHRQPGPVDPLPAVVGRRAGAETSGVQRLPLAAGAEHEEDGFHADAVGDGGACLRRRGAYSP